jgi:predicted RNA-binding protein with PIN domain
MILLLDGYNLLKYILRKDFVSEKDRALFIARLLSYAQHKKHTIILVFDGGPYDRPTYERKGIVSVLYAGGSQSADDVIKEYAERHQASQLVLVSSDRELQSFASRRQVATIDAATFATLMRERKEPPLKIVKSTEVAHKLQDKTNLELDALMQEGSTYILYKDESPKKNNESDKHRLSKEERKLLKIKKKL